MSNQQQQNEELAALMASLGITTNNQRVQQQNGQQQQQGKKKNRNNNQQQQQQRQQQQPTVHLIQGFTFTDMVKISIVVTFLVIAVLCVGYMYFIQTHPLLEGCTPKHGETITVRVEKRSDYILHCINGG